jgi:protein-tyrosine phosphatase
LQDFLADNTHLWYDKLICYVSRTGGDGDMTDIHCHILPGVDDGAENMDEAVAMARMAWESGVRTIIATPHCNLPGETGNYRSSAMARRFNTLRKAVRDAGIDLEILPGAEVLCTPKVPQLLDEKKLITLADSRYLLVEFFFDTPAEDITVMLDAVAAEGCCPLVAHPERYEAVKRAPEAAYAWYRKGYLLQLNKGSLLGAFGKTVQKTALHLLNRQVVHTVASDAHRATARTPHMQELTAFLRKQCSPDYVKLLTEDNPRRILRSEAVPPTQEVLHPQKRDT